MDQESFKWHDIGKEAVWIKFMEKQFVEAVEKYFNGDVKATDRQESIFD